MLGIGPATIVLCSANTEVLSMYCLRSVGMGIKESFIQYHQTITSHSGQMMREGTDCGQIAVSTRAQASANTYCHMSEFWRDLEYYYHVPLVIVRRGVERVL